MRGLVEFFVVIDAECISALARCSSSPGRLRRKEACGHRGHDGVDAEVAITRHLDVQSIARNLGVVPIDGEGDGCIAEHAEVERVMGVLPDVLAAEEYILTELLLQAGMELVAETGCEGSRCAWAACEQWIQHRIRATAAGKDQIFVERRFQRARVGNGHHRAGGFDVVGDAHARFRLVGIGEAVIKVLAETKVEVPVAGFDLVLDVEGQLLYVGVSEVVIKCKPPRVRS